MLEDSENNSISIEYPEECKKLKSNNTLDIPEDDKYVIFMETSGEEVESWYCFIKYKGNEENLKYLYDQLESIDWYILDELSTFDLDLENFVCSRTAKEMTTIDLNHYSCHRKFDGKLQKINLCIKSNNEKNMMKAFDILGYGQIEDFIDNEDINESESSTSNDEESSHSEDSEDSEDSEEKKMCASDTMEKKKREKGIPKELLESKLPRFAKSKRNHKKKRK
jgi:hypothetical protein